MAPQGQQPWVLGSAMFAKLARQLTKGRNPASGHRLAAPLKLVVNGEVKAERPPRGRRTLVCRWRALPGHATLACAWQIEVLADFGQMLRPIPRPAVVLVAGNDESGRSAPDEIAP
jgi:hypothetical protein